MKSIIKKYKNEELLTEEEQDAFITQLLKANATKQRRKQWEEYITLPAQFTTSNPKSKRIWFAAAAVFFMLLGAFLIIKMQPQTAQQFATNYLKDLKVSHAHRGIDTIKVNIMDESYKKGLEELSNKNYQAAIEQLNQITNGNHFEDAKWYKTLAYVKLNNINKACEVLNSLNDKKSKRYTELSPLLKCK